MDSSSVNPLPFPDIIEVDSLRRKCSGETTNQDGHCHGYMHYFHSVLLNHKTYSTLPRIHVRRESMARGTKEHFNFSRA